MKNVHLASRHNIGISDNINCLKFHEFSSADNTKLTALGCSHFHLSTKKCAFGSPTQNRANAHSAQCVERRFNLHRMHAVKNTAHDLLILPHPRSKLDLR